MASCNFFLALLLFLSTISGCFTVDYRAALHSSILFFEGQRSGRLPNTQRVHWRSHSALRDGFEQGVNLVGGYYDAGDNVKFGLPMAFTITMLSWSVLEYGHFMSSVGELGYAQEAIKWGTDYLIKAHPEPNLLWGEVGDGDTDHYCWQRPEDMTTSRQAYYISESNPGSDLAGETAAAMAAASLVFKNSSHSYSQTLLNHAKQLFNFADKHRGRYDRSISVAHHYYQSESGYDDELLWAALWLYEATSDGTYLNYAIQNAHALGGTGWAMTEFSWDVKYAGLQVIASKVDYILGDNPRGTSYMVGLGSNYPQKVHHRAASIVSYNVDPTFVACRKGYQTWYSSTSADPNVLVGALVGGPDEDDNYADDRVNFEQSEPATYNNGPIVGVLARLLGASNT